MGALPQTRQLNVPVRKGPAPETRKLDRFGRDPESPAELLRGGQGFSPLYHSMLADLPRLLEGSAGGWALVTTILRLSLGRPHASDKGRYEKTEPISTAELAELCRVSIKTIQRQLDELSTRGVIGLKQLKQAGGFVTYVLWLKLADWQSIEDYAVWQRRQVVAIDEALATDEAADEEPTEISKDAVHLTKKPQAVRPGRASRAVKVSVGVREISFQNDSSTVDALFNAVVTSGRLVVSTTFAKGESEAKGETKANAERHACRAVPPNEGMPNPPTRGEATHERAAEVCKLFDPILQKSGARLLSPDQKALDSACAELGALPHDHLVYFLHGPNGRAARPISNPKVIASIIRECRLNWEVRVKAHEAEQARREKWAGEVSEVPDGDEPERPVLTDREKAVQILADKDRWAPHFVKWAKDILKAK